MAASPEALPAALAPPAESRYQRLKPGPGRPAEQVGAHQRARFHSAMVELVAERGYAPVTLRDLTAVAKVSSRAFYEQFRGKEDCFLRTHDLIVRRAAKRIVTAQAGEHDWRGRLRLAFRGFAREIEREPAAARLALLEAHTAGPTSCERARRAERSFETMLADSLGRAPDGLGAPPLVAEGIVAGVAGVARRRLLASDGGRVEMPPDLADELLEWALACREAAAQASSRPFPSPSSKATMGSRSNMADRDLILAATAKLAATEPLDRLTVPRIRAAAGVSRRTFDAEFADVGDCVVTAIERRAEDAIDHARHAAARNSNPLESTRLAIASLCGELACDPSLARLCFSWETTPYVGLDAPPPIVNRIADLVSPGSQIDNPSPSVRAEASAALVWGVLNHRLPLSSGRNLCGVVAPLAALASGCRQ